MWMATTFGFYSVVQKKGESFLTVRARVREDLDALRAYCPELGPTIDTPMADYGFRAMVTHADWAQAMARIGSAIDYSNFKHEVELRQGSARASVYARVWAALMQLASLPGRSSSRAARK